MIYKISFDKPADKFLGKIIKSNRSIGQNIFIACLDLKNFSENSRGIKKLHTPFKGFRRRVGKYRILFLVSGKNIEIYKIGFRKDVYKKN